MFYFRPFNIEKWGPKITNFTLSHKTKKSTVRIKNSDLKFINLNKKMWLIFGVSKSCEIRTSLNKNANNFFALLMYACLNMMKELRK